MKLFFFVMLFAYLCTACNTSKKIAKQVDSLLIKDTALLNANIGISIYDPATNNYLYNHNGEKYFVPASNTKLLTCYAAMKYLGDSIIGLKYFENDTALFVQGTADPSFLLDEFKQQPVNDFLKNNKKTIYLNSTNWKEERWGSGWNWTDFGEDYCQERSVLPMYYNTVVFNSKNIIGFTNQTSLESTPTLFNNTWKNIDVDLENSSINASLYKELNRNIFYLTKSKNIFKKASLSFTTGDSTTCKVLTEKYKTKFDLSSNSQFPTTNYPFSSLHSQPTDSILKPMMHRSDNFFAEQSLLMVSNEKLGYMNDDAIISHIKKNDFVGIPQMPRWVDGSGLSRYNMFTPQSLVWLLNKMKNEFGMDRIKEILPTGGEGTLSSLYKNMQGFIFAKTGTLSNHAALSGFLYTKKNKLLIFSVLTSGYQGSATPVRKAVEKLLTEIREKY
jgi:D-alanyl-D-alanine carboxypeptidase/D-alanyl-D-alanine-endopeptidase (penicillin-binding protein 4)